MRSDYANEDISRREVDKDTYTLLPDEAPLRRGLPRAGGESCLPRKDELFQTDYLDQGKISGCPRKSTSTIRAGTGARAGFRRLQGRYRASGPPPASACAPWDRTRKRSWKYGKWPTTRRSPKISFCRRISRGRHENPVPGLRRLPLLVRFRPCRRGGRSLFGRTGLFRSACDWGFRYIPARRVRGIAQPISLNDPGNPDFPAAESAGRGALAARRLVAFGSLEGNYEGPPTRGRVTIPRGKPISGNCI